MYFFALQVMTTREDLFIQLFSKTMPELAVYSVKKKIHTRKLGKHVEQISCVFPGYLFFMQDDPLPSPTVISAMRRTRYFMRFLPGTDRIAPLSERDEELIRHLLSFGKEIGTSLVMFDENNRIKVLKGPLMGMEGRIVKVNRRKKRAKIRLDMNDSPILFDLGFELLESVPAKTP